MSFNPGCPDCSNPCCVQTCLDWVECALSCNCGCCTIGVNLAPNQDLAAGTILAQRNTDGLFAPYDALATNGLGIPKGLLKHHVITDGNGAITTDAGNMGICPALETQMYICGVFRLEDTHGNLEAALSYPSYGRVVLGFVGGTGLWALG